MGNCKKTTLGQSVNADSLRYIGEIAFFINGTASNSTENKRRIILTCNNNVRVLVGGGNTATINNQNMGSDFTLASGTYTIFFAANEHVVKVTKVYDITSITTFEHTSVLDIADLSYMANGATFMYWGSIAQGGSMDNLKVRTAGSIHLRSWNEFANVTGDLSSLNVFALDAQTDNGCFDFRNDSGIAGDISVFKDFNNVTKSKLRYVYTGSANTGKIYGNIEAFEDYTNLGNLILGGVELSGSLAKGLSGSTSFTILNIPNHSDAEDLKGLFDALYAKGKTSGTMTLTNPGTNKTVTYNGSTLAVNNGSTVTFSSSGWTFTRGS